MWYRDLLGAGSVVLGTVLSNNINHPILSPIVFAVGILLVISLDLGLITRSVPSGRPLYACYRTSVVNLTIAFTLGVLLSNSGNYPQELSGTLGGGVATGIVIGLVSVANIHKHKSEYTVLITMILMFSFVYLGLPHSVVYAFYLGTLEQITTPDVISLASVLVGNIIGGLIVRCSIGILDK